MTHSAWRFTQSKIAYVEWIGNGQQKGDRYSYTSNVDNAKKLTEAQARAFCKYMQDCGTVGFWS